MPETILETPDSVARAAHMADHALTDDKLGQKLILNMGPSHPSTHGVLRILLEMDGRGGDASCARYWLPASRR